MNKSKQCVRVLRWTIYYSHRVLIRTACEIAAHSNLAVFISFGSSNKPNTDESKHSKFFENLRRFTSHKRTKSTNTEHKSVKVIRRLLIDETRARKTNWNWGNSITLVSHHSVDSAFVSNMLILSVARLEQEMDVRVS